MTKDTDATNHWSAAAINALVDEKNGTVDSRIYSDRALYDLEMERVFGRSWLLLAHENHIPKPGDYLATYMGDDSVVIVRQKDGSVRAFLIQCRHRGMRVCRADAGNTRAFTCSYHGWAYDIGGRLVNVPLEKEAYGTVDKSQLPLHSVPGIATYKGLIFGNWDEAAPPLVDYLGESVFYMDMMLDRSDSGTEVIGGLHKWVIPCNWKFAAEQLCSDMYHLPSTHLSGFVARASENLKPEDMKIGTEGRQFRSEWGGHGAGFFLGSGGPQMMANTVGEVVANYWCVESADVAERRLGNMRARQMSGAHMTIFPNLSFLTGVNTVRIWHPRGPDEIEVWAFTIVDADASTEVKDDLRKNGLRAFSAAGLFEQDDAENWIEVQKVLRGHQARKQRFNVQMAIGREFGADPNLPGRIGQVFSEEAARGFYAHWARMMTEPSWSTLKPQEARHATG